MLHLGIRARRSMAPPTSVQNAQRMDRFEEEVANVRNTMTEEIAAAVAKAAADMQSSITNHIVSSMELSL